MITHLSLFTGIGGLDLAAEAAGMTTVGQCEWADYPTKVLEKHWPDVPRWRDIRTLTGDDFYAKTGLRTVDVISGGFPCQPFSVAGKQKGKGDDRYLWPEMLRVITELGPRWVVGENVPGILRIAASDVVADLERLGYHVVVFAFEAAAVGAYHRRERVAFVAHADSDSCRSRGAESAGQFGEARATDGRSDVANSDSGTVWNDGPDKRKTVGKEHSSDHAGHAGGTQDVANTQSDGLQGDRPYRQQVCRASASQGEVAGCGSVCHTAGKRLQEPEQKPRCAGDRESAATEWTCVTSTSGWPAEPDVVRVAHGIPNRVDRLKCLGNAVVPAQFYPIFKAIMEEEEHA